MRPTTPGSLSIFVVGESGTPNRCPKTQLLWSSSRARFSTLRNALGLRARFPGREIRALQPRRRVDAGAPTLTSQRSDVWVAAARFPRGGSPRADPDRRGPDDGVGGGVCPLRRSLSLYRLVRTAIPSLLDGATLAIGAGGTVRSEAHQNAGTALSTGCRTSRVPTTRLARRPKAEKCSTPLSARLNSCEERV